ncbi:MAG: hypothetical protein M3O70_02195 [Actinomycetota bacterium]|nr:hypothetical protein [Actinomycetota bacterium]
MAEERFALVSCSRRASHRPHRFAGALLARRRLSVRATRVDLTRPVVVTDTETDTARGTIVTVTVAAAGAAPPPSWRRDEREAASVSGSAYGGSATLAGPTSSAHRSRGPPTAAAAELPAAAEADHEASAPGTAEAPSMRATRNAPTSKGPPPAS